jgi:uncharacterized membrane protein
MPSTSATLRMPRPERVETLVDGVFSVAMTLLVLDIRLPESVHLASNADVLAHLGSIVGAMFAYALSFFVLAMFWLSHDFQFRYIEHIDGRLFWLNCVFLLLTTLVPFTTSLVSAHGDLSLPATLYAANLLFLTLTLILHARWLGAHPELAKSTFSPAIDRRATMRLRLFVAVPIVAMIVAQFAPKWGLRALLLLVLIHFLPKLGAGAASAATISADAPPE